MHRSFFIAYQPLLCISNISCRVSLLINTYHTNGILGCQPQISITPVYTPLVPNQSKRQSLYTVHAHTRHIRGTHTCRRLSTRQLCPAYVRTCSASPQPTRDLRGQTEPNQTKRRKATCARPRASAYVHIVALARTCAPHVSIGNKTGSDSRAGQRIRFLTPQHHTHRHKLV